MSELLKIALIAEGRTDMVIIEAALKAILPRPFMLTLLQPEATNPGIKGGWPVVLKWCRQSRTNGYASLEEDPTMYQFDFFILQIDADVAHRSYSDAGLEIEQEALSAGWGVLPCFHSCPPPDGTVSNLRSVLLSWLGVEQAGARTILCIPSKSTEAWLAVAVYPHNLSLLKDLECTLNMESRLAALARPRRIRKNVREYRNHSGLVTKGWKTVRELCSQAEVFHRECTAIYNLQEKLLQETGSK